MRYVVSAFLVLVWVGSGQGAVKTEVVEYRHGETVLQGYIAYDDAIQGKRPGVLVVHEFFAKGSRNSATMR